ncbi:DUF262 domain-containing protein [Mesorhizobium sp. B2-4-19]|uniref:DUF262 domain-containing protein n=1 Tax=Mesorhizobium sp. B2-4-19 TaxID=2589930 RepID=UPI00112CAA6B|nr:DUF262 domain-containing protein [Mesorhizobium sp. B2-4-19]TPK63061.1 DUF262 domain-containing protein [Mesorhizobium sp. B2-4-19]
MTDKPDLIAAIAASVRQANTAALDVSFNELLDMWENKELDIQPDYQRLFRWTAAQQSRFIESLLLEMPVPPIFVIEEESNTYQLIDGLQRISSYLHLRGKLEAPQATPPVQLGDMLVLEDCDIVPELNGLSYDDLPTALQIRLKRRFIRMEVVRKETDRRFKYHMFKRLNTGGETLSAHQVRNSAMRMLSDVFPNFVVRMAQVEEFKSCTEYLTYERRMSAFDEELVLRFFALKNQRAQFKHEVTDFLDEYMEAICDPSRNAPFNYGAEELSFRKTFRALWLALGEYAFAFANRDKTALSLGFSIYHFEGITIGIQSVINRIDLDDGAVLERLGTVLRGIKLDPAFIAITTGGGKNSPGPLNARISFVSERLEVAFP